MRFWCSRHYFKELYNGFKEVVSTISFRRNTLTFNKDTKINILSSVVRYAFS